MLLLTLLKSILVFFRSFIIDFLYSFIIFLSEKLDRISAGFFNLIPAPLENFHKIYLKKSFYFLNKGKRLLKAIFDNFSHLSMSLNLLSKFLLTESNASSNLSISFNSKELL